MPTYATIADLEAYIVGFVAGDPDEDDRLIEKAERDVDQMLGMIPIADDSTTGLKLDPTTLLAWERAALSDAVCAQVEWRILKGDSRGEAVARRVKGPEFEKEMAVADGTTTRRVGPQVGVELDRIHHLRVLSARAAP